ncbi:hypothetical protein AMECASPLE_032905 [Ameca splendens]|uniref:Uncharacterized protein n=1 Tax=Ameca splendens TaxID=208324 RepID=A0ABV0ZT22_9TELE
MVKLSHNVALMRLSDGVMSLSDKPQLSEDCSILSRVLQLHSFNRSNTCDGLSRAPGLRRHFFTSFLITIPFLICLGVGSHGPRVMALPGDDGGDENKQTRQKGNFNDEVSIICGKVKGVLHHLHNNRWRQAPTRNVTLPIFLPTPTMIMQEYAVGHRGAELLNPAVTEGNILRAEDKRRTKFDGLSGTCFLRKTPLGLQVLETDHRESELQNISVRPPAAECRG